MLPYWSAIPIGLSIGIAIVALAWMLASALSADGLRAWARMELSELLLSTILVLIVVLVVEHSSGILMPAASLNSPGDVSGVMYRNLEEPLQAVIKNMASDAFRMTKVLGYNYNGQLAVPFLSRTYSNSPGAGANPLMMQLIGGMDTTSMTLLLAKSVRVLFLFLLTAMTGFILPLAVLLRFIPFTRKIAGTLMGVALAVILVFPTAAMWSMQMGNSFVPQANGIGTGNGICVSGATADGRQLPAVICDPGNPPARDVICNKWMSGVYTIGEVAGPSIICGILSIFGVPFGKPPSPAPIFPGVACSGWLGTIWWIVQFFFQVNSSSTLSGSALAMSSGQIVNTIYVPLQTAIMPPVVGWNLAVLLMIILMLAPTIVLARNFGQVLGGEAQIYGLTRLI